MRTRSLAPLTVALGALVLAAPATADVQADLDAAKNATLKYRDVARAIADGYAQGSPCTTEPPTGAAMGTHFVNAALRADGIFDPRRPEELLYVPHPSGKGLKLVAVEYHKPDDDQNLATFHDRPTMFERPFDGPMPGHGPGEPIHYDLHVWVHLRNPNGMFAQFNPAASCVLAMDKVSVPRVLRARPALLGGIPVTIEVGREDSRITATLSLGRSVLGRARLTAKELGRTRLRVKATRNLGGLHRALAARPRVALRLQLDSVQPGGYREKRVLKVTLRRPRG
jgi:hypothetical protein